MSEGWNFDRLEADVMDPAVAAEPAAEFRIGKYRVGAELARGAMGVVHHGEDTELKRAVAVKILREVAGSNPVIRQRFQREAQAAAMLVHPNVVRVYDAGEDGGRAYLIMELVDGHPLSKLLGAARGDLPSILRLLERAARGVAAAHEKRIIHRDVKPANILVTQSGEPKVGDFGLAHLMDAEVSLTQTGMPMGTPAYMAPEQVRGDTSRISPATDVYSLGAILYEILTGRPPHDAGTSLEIYKRILETDPEPPRRLDARIPADLETIALKALDREPERRYADAGAFADDLARHLAGEPILARPLSPLARAWRKGLRHRRTLLLAAVFLALGGWLASAFREKAELARREAAVRETLKLIEAARPALDRAELSAYLPEDSSADSEKRVAEARNLITRAIALAPDPSLAAIAWNLDGRAWDLIGKERPAEVSWRKAIALDPKHAPPHYFVARILILRSMLTRAGDPEGAARLAGEAKRELEAAKAAGGGFDSELQRVAADATLALTSKDLERARAICREALARHGSGPGTETLHWILGQIAADADEALEAYSAAIRIRPRYAMALLCRGLHHYFVRHSTREAFADLDAAVRANPNFSAGFNARGDISYREKDFVAAEADFTALISLDNGDGGGSFNRANARGGQGNLEGAVLDYSEAIRIRPSWDAAWFYRGRTKAAAGDAKGALEDFAQALNLNPPWIDINVDRAFVRERTGDLRGAIEDLERALRDAPADWAPRAALQAKLSEWKASKPRDF